METINDIVREMRNLGRLDEKSTDKIPRSLQGLGLRTYADRIEAALEFELAVEKSKAAGEGYAAGKQSVTECNQHSNAAKMREALEAVVKVGYPHNFQREAPHISGYCYDITKAITKCFDALSAPASIQPRIARCLKKTSPCCSPLCFARWAQMPYEETKRRCG